MRDAHFSTVHLVLEQAIFKYDESLNCALEVVDALNKNYDDYRGLTPNGPQSIAIHFDPINELLLPTTKRPKNCGIDCSKCSVKLEVQLDINSRYVFKY
jgi:hypothetical protein